LEAIADLEEKVTTPAEVTEEPIIDGGTEAPEQSKTSSEEVSSGGRY